MTSGRTGHNPDMPDDDDLGLFGPDSVTWRVHADPSMLIGGLRALLIQALHPHAMAGVDQHSDYRQDQWNRLRQTSDYVLTTTFGTTVEAQEYGTRVRRVHEYVRGVDPVTGQEYSAGDPDVLLWVHNVEVHSFLLAYRRYGGWLSSDDADRYVAEMVQVAELVGIAAGDVPASHDDLSVWLRERRSGLVVSEAARTAMEAVLRPPMPLPARPLWAIPARAAIAILPRHVRRLYGLPWQPPVDALVRVSVTGLFRALNLVAPTPPHVRDARARVDRAAAAA
jgi:uncharacterized protein (DUF2236 family)